MNDDVKVTGPEYWKADAPMTITEGVIVHGKVYAAAEGTCVECALLPMSDWYHCQGLCGLCESMTKSERSMCLLEVRGARVVAEPREKGPEPEPEKPKAKGRKK